MENQKRRGEERKELTDVREHGEGGREGKGRREGEREAVPVVRHAQIHSQRCDVGDVL